MSINLTENISSKDTSWKATFFKQMFILISSNINVDGALKLLLDSESSDSKYKKILNNLYSCVLSGDSLSTAMKIVGVIFSDVEINMIFASERIGKLDVALEQLADFGDKFLKMRRKILSSMIYPAIVLAISVIVLVVLSVFVVPRFEVIFLQSASNYKLPWLTLTVISSCRFFAEHIWMIFCLFFVSVFLFSLAIRQQKFCTFFDWLAVSIPVVGTIIVNYNICLFFKTAGSLLKFSVPIQDCFVLSQTVIPNKKIFYEFRDSLRRLHVGDLVFDVFKRNKFIKKSDVGLILAGEESGSLWKIFLQIANNCEETIDTLISRISIIIEPVMIIFLALVVGLIVVSLFLPMINMMSSFG